MTKSKKELVLTGPPPYPGGTRPRLRVLKSVQSPEGNTYLVPFPGIAPPSLHFSRHPWGDIHWKAQEGGTFGRGNVSLASRAVRDGTLDRVISSLIVRPQRQRSAWGVIVPRTQTETIAGAGSDLDLEIDSFVASLQPVTLGDTRHLAGSLHVLRNAGTLHLLDALLVSDFRYESSLIFFNLTKGRAIPIPSVVISREMPFWRSALAALSHLREYGGVFIAFPEGRRFQATAKRLGLSCVADGISFLEKSFETYPWNPELESRVRALETGFMPALARLTLKRPIRVTALRRGKPIDFDRPTRSG